jgi:uncharacterized protein (DUF488 family)
MTNTLFTIGYSTRTVDDLIGLLKQHKITALCDVRLMPYNSRNAQYNREPLRKALKAQKDHRGRCDVTIK